MEKATLAKWSALAKKLKVPGAAAVIAAALYITARIGMERKFQKFFHPTRVLTLADPNQYNLSPDEIAFTYHKGKHEIELVGWSLPTAQIPRGPTEEKPPLIELVHGFGQNRANFDGILAMAKSLNDAGCDVETFDLPNHGFSDDGDKTSFGINEVPVLVEKIKADVAQGYRRIGLQGMSMGSFTSIVAALKILKERDENPDGPLNDLTSLSIFVDSSCTDLKPFLQEAMQVNGIPAGVTPVIANLTKPLVGLDLEQIKPLEAAKTLVEKYGVAIFDVHHAGDKLIGVHHAEEFKELLGDDHVWITPAPEPGSREEAELVAKAEAEKLTENQIKAHHCFSYVVDPDRYIQLATEHFARHLIRIPHQLPTPEPKPTRHIIRFPELWSNLHPPNIAKLKPVLQEEMEEPQ